MAPAEVSVASNGQPCCGRPHSLEFSSHGRGCMIQTSLAKRIALAAAGGLVSCLLAATPVALAIRAGAPKPDISTVDALKRTLLAAKSIVYADPAKGGASGVYFAHVVDRLGIADQLKSKTILVPGAQAAEVVAKGEAEIGVAQTSEIVPVAGAEVLGPLPGEFASTTLWTAAIGATTKAPEAAKSLIQFLTGPVARPVFSAKGFQPG